MHRVCNSWESVTTIKGHYSLQWEIYMLVMCLVVSVYIEHNCVFNVWSCPDLQTGCVHSELCCEDFKFTINPPNRGSSASVFPRELNSCNTHTHSPSYTQTQTHLRYHCFLHGSFRIPFGRMGKIEIMGQSKNTQRKHLVSCGQLPHLSHG